MGLFLGQKEYTLDKGVFGSGQTLIIQLFLVQLVEVQL